MSPDLARIFVVLVQAILGFAYCPSDPIFFTETVIQEAPKNSVLCEFKAVSGADLPQNEFTYSPRPTQPYYAGSASSASVSPSPSFEDTTG